MNTFTRNIKTATFSLCGVFVMFFLPVSAEAQISISGTVFEADGVTPLSGVATVTAAIATATPSLHSVQIGSGGATEWSPQILGSIDPPDAWQSVTYGNGLFVAVGGGDSFGGSNRIATSPDGITWTMRTTPDSDYWYSVTYGNGLFVAVGDGELGNEIATSPDGITWTPRNSAAGVGRIWFDVTYGGGMFVAVGSDNEVILTSTNGTTWTEQFPPDDARVAGWNGVTYGNGTFVVVGLGVNGVTTHAVLTSSDGVTWTKQSAAGNNDQWSDVTYGNGTFVAVGGGPDRVMTSTNGTTWTVQSAAGDNDRWFDITYGGGLFVAAGFFGGTSDDYLITSPDGVTWTAQDVFESPLSGIGYGDGLYVAVTIGGVLTAPGASSDFTISGIATSSSAVNWVTRTPISVDDDWQSVTYGNGLFVAVSDFGSNVVMTSPDGISWTARTAPAGSWRSVTYGNGLFVAVGSGANRVMTSSDGITWTARTATASNWRSVTYGNGLFVVVGSGSGDRVMTSSDGITWTTQPAAGNNDTWASVTYGDGLFVAVGLIGDRVMTSPDGVTWTVRSAVGNNDSWASVTYGGGLFVAVGQFTNDLVMTSPDGITWTAGSAAGNNDRWQSVTYGNGLFVAVGGLTGDRVMTSPDGITWTVRSAAGNNDDWMGVVYADGIFVAVGESGDTIMTALTGFDNNTPITLFLNNGTEYATTLLSGPELGYDSLANIRLTADRVTFASASTTLILAKANFYDSSYDRDIHFSSVAGTTSIGSAATSTSFQIATSTVVNTTKELYLYGDLIQNGILIHRGISTTTLAGSGLQTVVGNLVGSSSFSSLVVDNDSGNGTTTQSVIFDSPMRVSNIYKMTSGSSAAFTAGATTTVQNIDLLGNSESPIWLRSTESGEQVYFDVPGTQINVSYVDVKDSRAITTITASSSTDSGNNTNWNFGGGSLVTGSSTIDSHDEGRVSNAFSFQNKTNEELFSFKLIPQSGTATVTDIVITLSGVKKVDASDFSDFRLLRDLDDDSEYDVLDEAVGGTGVMVVNDSQGTVTFTEDFLASTTQNFIVVANWSAPENGSFMRMTLSSDNLQMTDALGLQTIFGEVPAVQHSRNNQGGGGGVVATIGGEAPAGDGVQTGGETSGGEQIGNEPNFKSPTAFSGTGWQAAANAYDRVDGTYATTSGTSPTAWQNHTFGVNSGNTILGIAVQLEVSATTPGGTIGVQLSPDGGSTWTETKTTPTLTTSDTVVTLGGTTDLWGRSWNSSQFSDANFRVRLTGAPNGNTIRVDEIQVRVYHQAGGGGGGGGADI